MNDWLKTPPPPPPRSLSSACNTNFIKCMHQTKRICQLWLLDSPPTNMKTCTIPISHYPNPNSEVSTNMDRFALKNKIIKADFCM